MSSQQSRRPSPTPMRAILMEAKEGEHGFDGAKESVRPESARPLTVGAGDGMISEKIDYLQEATDLLTKRIEMERRKSEELDKKIKISRGKVEESRARMKGSDEASALKQRSKAVRSAEHRLDVIMARINTINKHNETMRTGIESLRRDKIQRQRIVKRMEKEVSDARKRLETVSVEAASATETRDKAEREIAALEATINREATQFEAEFTTRMAAFTDAVSNRKRSAEHPNSEREGLGLSEDNPASVSQTALGRAMAEEPHGSMTVEQEVELKHKSIKTLWEIARREVEVKEQSAKLAELEEAFGKIQESTGISTIDEMVNAFVQTEDRNYAILTMINDLNREIEAAEVENASLRAAVEEARSRGSVGHASRDRLSKDWDMQLKTMLKRAALQDKQYESAMRSLDAVKPSVHSIFQKVGSSDSAAAESLAAAGVTDGNIMLHLGLIEQRVSELMHLYDMSMQGIPLTLPTEEEEAALVAAGLPAGSPTPHANLDVEISRVGGIGSTDGSTRNRRAVVVAPIPPSLADLDESEDEADVFLTMPSVGLGTLEATKRGPAGRARRQSFVKVVEEQEADLLLEPMSLEELRQHTVALVERKQAKADRRERLAEQARNVFADQSFGTTVPGVDFSPQRVGFSASSTMRGAALASVHEDEDTPAASSASVQVNGQETSPSNLVPRPPSQPAARPAGARPGTRTGRMQQSVNA